MDAGEGEFNLITTALNNNFDREGDDISAELVAIVSHRSLPNILELQVEYTTDECCYHSLNIIKDEDPQVIANYIICNDLSKLTIGQTCCWDHTFLCLLKKIEES